MSGSDWPGLHQVKTVVEIPGHHIKRPLVGDESRRENKTQGAEKFQKEGDADGRDQSGNARSIAQRLVSRAFYGDRHQRADHHRKQDYAGRTDDHHQHVRQSREKRSRPDVELEAGNGVETDKRAHHKNIAMGEIDQLDDAINHRVAKCNQSVDKPQLQAADNDLNE